MKKIFLFLTMIVLVLMTARSIFCLMDLYDPWVNSGTGALGQRFTQLNEQTKFKGETGLLHNEINTYGTMMVDDKRIFCPLDRCTRDQRRYVGLLAGLQHDLSNPLTEFSLQQLLNILDKEIDLVAHLYHGRTGYFIENKIIELVKLKRQTVPSVLDLYTKIMIQATLGPESAKRCMRGTRVKKIFLSTMRSVLERYCIELRQLQCKNFVK